MKKIDYSELDEGKPKKKRGRKKASVGADIPVASADDGEGTRSCNYFSVFKVPTHVFQLFFMINLCIVKLG